MDFGKEKILVRKTSNVNLNTGEVVEREESFLLKMKKREKFMFLYVENFALIADLTKRAQEVLALILTKKITYGTNEAVLNIVFREEMAEKLETSVQVIHNAIAELRKKKIFKKTREGYFLNPYLFGQGEWNLIQKQRHQFIIDYDFINYTAEKEIQTITAYEGLPDEKNVQIIASEKYITDDGIEKHDIIIEPKNIDNEKVEIVENIKELESSNFEPKIKVESNEIENKKLELEIIKENNKAKELELKEMELKIKLKELELQKNLSNNI